MKKLYDEPAAYSTADIANALMQERDRKLPVRSSFFNALVPKVSAQDAAINRPDPVERASLFPFATYPDGSTKLAIPGMIAEDIPRAFTAPSRAYRGEIPDEDMISEGLNFAGNMAIGGSAVPKGSAVARVAANASESAAPGALASEAARQPIPVKMEVPFYRGSAHGQTSVNYDQPYWGVAHGIPDVAQKLASDYAKSRSRTYFDAEATPNVTPAVARFRNPLEVDAQNAGWSQIPFEGGTISTDKLADLAKERGHDGLVVNRLYDEGRVDEALGLPSTVAALRPGTVSSAFDPNNILYSNSKSAAPGVLASEASKRKPWYSRLFGSDIPDAPPGSTIVDGYHGRTHPRTYRNGLWGSTSHDVASAYANKVPWDTGNKKVHNIQARFSNPMIIDAEGAYYDRLPGKHSGIQAYYDDALSKGHDGLIVKNVEDPPVRGRAPIADTFAAIKRGTVYDKDTGKLLYSNSDAVAPGVLASEASKRVENPIRASHVSRADFDKFDFGKIGSGYGHLDEGHGLYFGQHKGLLDSYAKEFGPDAKRYDVAIHADESKFGDWDTLPPDIKAALKTERGARAAAQSGMPGVVVKHPEGNSYVLFDQSTPIDILTKYQNPDTAKAPGALMVEGAKDRRQ